MNPMLQTREIGYRKLLSLIFNLTLMSAGSPCSQIWQHPRFAAKKRSSVVKFHCYTNHSGALTWFRKRGSQQPQELVSEEGHIVQTQNGSVYTLTIQNIQYEDNGIYFCKQKCDSANHNVTDSCGTELLVLGVCQVDCVAIHTYSPAQPSYQGKWLWP